MPDRPDLDPQRLARRQLDLDRERTGKHDLLPRKIARMTASPLAFLRGSDRLFYEMLAARPELARGPAGEGWIVGDAHLENFGAYRPDATTYAAGERRGEETPTATFDLNDFDEAVRGPWQIDVLRLATSLILGGRELGASGRRALALCNELIGAYVGAAFGKARLPPVPRPVEGLVDQVRARSRRELLDARTRVVKRTRSFVRGDRYRDLSPAIAAKLPRALAAFAAGLPASARPTEEQLAIVDAAFRIAGNGSLGALRVAVLVRGKGGVDGAWILDVKEQGEPSATALLATDAGVPAERVRDACLASLAHPPRMIGTTSLAGKSMFVRRLAPQEDKLDLAHLADADLDALATYLGALLGTAHARAARADRARRRGGSGGAGKAWTDGEKGALLDRAIAVAGLHEATYLAYCRLVDEKGGKATTKATRRRRS